MHENLLKTYGTAVGLSRVNADAWRLEHLEMLGCMCKAFFQKSLGAMSQLSSQDFLSTQECFEVQEHRERRKAREGMFGYV